MKKIISTFAIAAIIFISGCSKDTKCTATDSPVVAPASEIANVQTYLNTNGITGYQQTSTGLFYKITAPGSGTVIANLCSYAIVNYTGKLTNGTVFDATSGTPISIQLGSVIVGWQKGVPLIAKGGKITLYIPPTLGYGASAVGAIPANSILIFDIELVDVNNQ